MHFLLTFLRKISNKGKVIEKNAHWCIIENDFTECTLTCSELFQSKSCLELQLQPKQERRLLLTWYFKMEDFTLCSLIGLKSYWYFIHAWIPEGWVGGLNSLPAIYLLHRGSPLVTYGELTRKDQGHELDRAMNNRL